MEIKDNVPEAQGLPSGFSLGERVLYVPAQHHGLEKDAAGDYAWLFGHKKNTGKVVKDELGRDVPETVVEELLGKRINEYFQALKNHPNPMAEVKENLVFIRPNKAWQAEVRGGREVMTQSGLVVLLDLDIQAANGGVTLHYDNVPFQQDFKQPHTCHRPKKASA